MISWSWKRYLDWNTLYSACRSYQKDSENKGTVYIIANYKFTCDTHTRNVSYPRSVNIYKLFYFQVSHFRQDKSNYTNIYLVTMSLLSRVVLRVFEWGILRPILLRRSDRWTIFLVVVKRRIVFSTFCFMQQFIDNKTRELLRSWSFWKKILV